MKKTIRQVGAQGLETTLAIFEMEQHGTKVKTKWESTSFKHYITTLGIPVEGKTFFPQDGKDFIDAISRHFSDSTTVRITES